MRERGTSALESPDLTFVRHENGFAIFKAGWALTQSGELWLHLEASSLRLVAGFVLGAIPGIAIGLVHCFRFCATYKTHCATCRPIPCQR